MVDFLGGKSKKNASDPGSERIEWSEPAEERADETRSGSRWTGIFKDRDKEAIRKEQFNRSRHEVLSLIHGYVREKENVGEPKLRGAAIPKAESERKGWLDFSSVFSKNQKIPPPSAKGPAAPIISEASAGSRPLSAAKPPAVPAESVLKLQEEPRSGASGEKPLSISGRAFGLFNHKKKDPAGIEGAILATDLIKSELVAYFDWKKNLILMLVVILASISLVAAANYGLNSWKERKVADLSQLSENVNELDKQIGLAENNIDKIMAFQKKADSAKFLLDNHIYWTKLFKFLEENTLADVSFKGFEGDSNGDYALSAKTGNFNTLAKQLAVLKLNDKVISASSSGGETRLEDKDKVVFFDLRLKLDPKIFFNK